MKCDKCGKETFDSSNASGSVGMSGVGVNPVQTSIYERYINVANGRFYYIKCRLLNKRITYCESCCRTICVDKCVDCVAIKRDKKLEELGI